MNYDKTIEIVHKDFESSIIPALSDYIKIDNLSPEYDPEWKTNGKLEKAAQHIIDWASKQNIKGLKAQILKEENRSPMVYIQIPATSDDIKKTILLYAHFDKQPHMTGWREGLGPLKPVIQDGYLYGRGASDDGYASFTIVESIKAIQEQGGKHGKIFITIEGGEESGSPDLMYYLNKIAEDMGKPDFMICMDSGCIDYNTLWITTSLRGIAKVELTVEVLKESVHSGTGSGIAPDSFTIMRQLLDRLEDSKTSKVVDDLQVQIPDYRIEDAKKLAEYQKEKIVEEHVKLLDGVKPLNDDYTEVILNNTWRAMLTVVGMTGFPPAEGAGNVLRAKTKCNISMRLPPTYDAKKAIEVLGDIHTKDKLLDAKITAHSSHFGNGFASKNFSEKVKNSFSASSKRLFGKDFYCFGEGGSIPFISELGKQYPECEILVTGVLGPNTNAHCPNEALNLKYTESMIVALAHLINDYSS